jgi:hypothetical protein
MLRCAISLGFILLGCGASLAEGEDEYDLDRIEAMAKAAPPAVARFIDRKLECFHGAGEEPYSKARAREIQAAYRRLNCDGLEKDETRLRKSFARDRNALAALDEAKTLPF